MNSLQLKYTIQSLFTGERKIVIPDMQREYCWAYVRSETNGKSLVENFVRSLLQVPATDNHGVTVRLGLLYGYESPIDRIQLCDGQQRLTTLFLLSGILCRKLARHPMRGQLENILISESEEKDDREPRLQYAIRESTLFFLRDLVWSYFLGRDENVAIDGSDAIRKQSWYFSEYDLDPTITNMLQAIDIMTKIVPSDEGLPQFADLVTSRIEFLIFDMRDRTHGEEQFVVLNTTGKPLTTTENIKPVFLADVSSDRMKMHADLWEDWEQFFWQNRNRAHAIADFGLNELFRWIYILEHSSISRPESHEADRLTDAQRALAEKPFDLASLLSGESGLNTIERYVQTIKRLSVNSELRAKYLFQAGVLNQITCFSFLPVLQYAYLFPDVGPESRMMTRVIRFFESRAKNANIRKTSVMCVFSALEVIREMKRKNIDDIAQVAGFTDCFYNAVLTSEEILKFRIYLKASNREDVEDAIWEAERLQCCCGEVQLMFKVLHWDVAAGTLEFDLDSFKRLTSIVKQTLEKPNDLLRRALLCQGNYSRWDGNTPMLGATRYSLGEDAAFFGETARDEIRGKYVVALLSYLYEKCEPTDEKTLESLIMESLQNLIDAFSADEKSPESAWEAARYAMIKDGNILKRLEQQFFAVSYDEKTVFGLTQRNVTQNDKYFVINRLQ